jgi:protein-tyrosine phosphatase
VIVYVLAIGASRALITEPLTVRFAGSEAAVRAEGRRALGFAGLLGLGLGVVCCIAGVAVGAPLRSVLPVLGACFPLLLVQDSGRIICFALKRPRTAALNDGAWLVLMVTAIAVLLALGDTSLWVLVAAWLVPGVFSGLLILGQLALVPSLQKPMSWITENRNLSIPLFHAFLLTAAPPYLLYAVAPAVSSLATLGVARAAYVPFSAFGVFLQSGWLLLLPAASNKSVQKTARLAVVASVALGSVALVWGLLIAVALPDAIGHLIIGARWFDTETERVLFGFALLLQACAIGPLLALTALREPERLVRVRSFTAPLVLGGGLVLAAQFGAIGIAVGILLGDALFFVLSWSEFRKLISRDSRSVSTGALKLANAADLPANAEDRRIAPRTVAAPVAEPAAGEVEERISAQLALGAMNPATADAEHGSGVRGRTTDRASLKWSANLDIAERLPRVIERLIIALERADEALDALDAVVARLEKSLPASSDPPARQHEAYGSGRSGPTPERTLTTRPRAVPAPRILFVCTANICRSPMAAALLRHRLDELGVAADIRTAGFLEPERPVSDGAMRVLAARQLDVSEHRSRRLDAELVRSATLVVGMERRHVRDAVVLAPEAWPRTFTLKELLRRGASIGPRTTEPFDGWLARVHLGRSSQDSFGPGDDDVDDPYGRSDDAFRLTAAELDDLLADFVDLAWTHAAGEPSRKP